LSSWRQHTKVAAVWQGFGVGKKCEMVLALCLIAREICKKFEMNARSRNHRQVGKKPEKKICQALSKKI